jgi:hypothetical protein
MLEKDLTYSVYDSKNLWCPPTLVPDSMTLGVI